MTEGTRALRGRVVTFRDDPFQAPSRDCLVYEERGAVVLRDGRIVAAGPWDSLRESLPAGAEVVDYGEAIIGAGFVDAHVHYPQMSVIASFGTQLLEWLETYTFPAEQAFADKAHADVVAKLFFREILRAGTTTACVYCTVHPQSVDAFFEESSRWNARMVAGKVLMDRNAPAALRDTAQSGYDDSAALIARWHGRGRQHYCVTPRFAPTSTPEQLEAAGALMRLREDLFMQTHISENVAEIAWVKELFPARDTYLDVYAKVGLIGPRSVLGHGIHLSEGEMCACHASGVALAHCPTSNMFLGSGLFRLFDATDPKRPVRVALGTDVGGGTNLSHLVTMGEAYKVAAMGGRKLDAVQAFWLATAGGAKALYLDDRIGRVAPGFDADLCVLDPAATPFLAFRTKQARSIEEMLFVLMTMGDAGAVRATWVAGECVYDRERAEPFVAPIRRELLSDAP